jgi:hypothetical protein
MSDTEMSPSPPQDDYTQLWDYWELEEWEESEIVPQQELLENGVFELRKVLKEEDWTKIVYDYDYIKEHFADKEKESYLFDCKEVDEIKEKIISHFA